MERDDYSEALYLLRARRRVQHKLEFMLRAYSLMGLLMAILAGGYVIVTLLPIQFTTDQIAALMTTGVGIALGLMSWMLLILRKARESVGLEEISEYETVTSFLDTWARFEQISKESISFEDEEFNLHSLRSVISRLYEEDKLDKRDLIALEEALQARNSIVHKGGPFPTRYAETLTDSLVEIIKKLEVPHS